VSHAIPSLFCIVFVPHSLDLYGFVPGMKWWFNIFQLIVFETLLSCRFFHVFPSRNQVNTPIGPSIHGLPCRKPRDLCRQLRADPRNEVSSFNQTWGWHGDLLFVICQSIYPFVHVSYLPYLSYWSYLSIYPSIHLIPFMHLRIYTCMHFYLSSYHHLSIYPIYPFLFYLSCPILSYLTVCYVPII